MKTIQELGDTTSTTTGIANLNPKIWLKEINDAAAKTKFLEQFGKQIIAPVGTKDVVQPYRSKYLASMTSTITQGGAVSFTTLDNLNGVTFTPAFDSYGVAISNYALQVNALNLVQAAKEELTHYLGTVTETAIAAALAASTDTVVGTAGAQNLYGGDATSTATLAEGDVLTPSLVIKAKKYLMSTKAKYWSGGSEATSTDPKNPWKPVQGDPFVMFIAPEQMNELADDSQFTNASEYGSSDVVMNGEIGNYQGIKIVTTDILTSSSTWGGGSLDGHTCYLTKPNAAYGVAYGKKPTLEAFDYPSELEKRMILWHTFHADTIHDDAIVKISVSDA